MRTIYQDGNELTGEHDYDMDRWCVDKNTAGYDYCMKHSGGTLVLVEYWDGCEFLPQDELERECELRWIQRRISGDDKLSLCDKSSGKTYVFLVHMGN